MLRSSSDGEEDFDVLGPISWPIESCFPMGAKVFSSTPGMLWRMRCIVINAFFFKDDADRFGIRDVYSVAPL